MYIRLYPERMKHFSLLGEWSRMYGKPWSACNGAARNMNSFERGCVENNSDDWFRNEQTNIPGSCHIKYTGCCTSRYTTKGRE